MSAEQRAVDHVVGQPALGLGGTHAVGVVSEDARVDHGERLSAGGGRPSPQLLALTASPYLLRCPPSRARGTACSTARSRVQLGWAALCFGAVRGADPGRSCRSGPGWSTSTTAAGPRASGRIDDAVAAAPPARGIEIAFAPRWLAAYSLVLAALLWSRNHRRAAAYVRAGDGRVLRRVPAGQGARRPRPPGVAGDRRRPHGSTAYPSGHATMTAAFAVVLIVLAVMLLRRANIRRLVGLLAGLMVVARLPRPGAARSPLPQRRRGRPAPRRRRSACSDWRSTAPCRAATPSTSTRCLHGFPRRAAACRRAQPDQGGGRRPVPGDRGRDGRRGRLVGTDLAPHHGRGLRHRPGRAGLGRGRRPGDRVRRRRHRPRGVRRARRHRHPGRHRARPAPATCSPATSTSRSTSGPRSTSR